MRTMSVLSAAMLIVFLALAEVLSPSPILIWNKTDSVQRGLYVVVGGPVEHGSIVAVQPSFSVRKFISARQYLPLKVPLLKQVFAMEGQVICRLKDSILMDKIHIATVQKHDNQGRKMPVWDGCFTLQTDEYFLLNAHPNSLDGRYFKQTTAAEIVGVYRHISDFKLF